MIDRKIKIHMKTKINFKCVLQIGKWFHSKCCKTSRSYFSYLSSFGIVIYKRILTKFKSFKIACNDRLSTGKNNISLYFNDLIFDYVYNL